MQYFVIASWLSQQKLADVRSRQLQQTLVADIHSRYWQQTSAVDICSRQSEQTYLRGKCVLKLDQLELRVVDSNGSSSDDRMDGLPTDPQQVTEPDLHVTTSHYWLVQYDLHIYKPAGSDVCKLLSPHVDEQRHALQTCSPSCELTAKILS